MVFQISDPLFSILVGLGAGLISIILVVIMLRIRPAWPPVYVFIVCISISEILCNVIGILLVDEFYFWPASAIVGVIGIVNFFAFSAVYKSVSLQMLTTLYTQASHRVDKSVLVEKIARPAVNERIELLVEMRLASKSPDLCYTITDKGLATVKRLHKIQRLFGLRNCGLYRRS